MLEWRRHIRKQQRCRETITCVRQERDNYWKHITVDLKRDWRRQDRLNSLLCLAVDRHARQKAVKAAVTSRAHKRVCSAR